MGKMGSRHPLHEGRLFAGTAKKIREWGGDGSPHPRGQRMWKGGSRTGPAGGLVERLNVTGDNEGRRYGGRGGDGFPPPETLEQPTWRPRREVYRRGIVVSPPPCRGTGPPEALWNAPFASGARRPPAECAIARLQAGHPDSLTTFCML